MNSSNIDALPQLSRFFFNDDGCHDGLVVVEGAPVGGSLVDRAVAFVDRYARRVYPAVLEQHPGSSVCSPLGAWLLLAACVSAAGGEDRAAVEEVLGCSAEDASELLGVFMAEPPSALRAAMAVWVKTTDATEEFAGWVRGLPPAVESGFMPIQRDADEWAERNTMGLIKSFPLPVDKFARVVLASALATKVSWATPFGVVTASEHLGESSPWRGKLQRLLWDGDPAGRAMIANTEAAGVVAVHRAAAREDLTVISVSADPAVPRRAVLEAAHEVAERARTTVPSSTRSLFELPLGTGHSWQIVEREVPTDTRGERVERIAGVSLPAWRTESQLNLKASPLFGTAPALEVLRRLIGPQPHDQTEATQAAVATFSRYGFEAAAVTGHLVPTSLRVHRETGIERTAVLRFDHPYAAVAIAGWLTPAGPVGLKSTFTGLPLFSAWVHEPHEAWGEATNSQIGKT